VRLLYLFSFAAVLFAQQLPKPIQDLVDGDHWKRARALVASQLKQNPQDPQSLLAMSIIEESFGDRAKARAFAEQAVAKAPQDPYTHAQLARVCAESAETGSVFRQLNNIRVMKRELDAAYKIDPNNLDALLVEMMFTYKAPAVVGGSKAKAHEIARRIGQHHPDWASLVEAKLAQQDQQEPVAIQALARVPQNFRAQANLGLVYCCLSPNPKHEEAARIAKMLIQKEPSRVNGYEIMARVHAARLAIKDLEKTLAEALHNVPEDLSPFYWAAKTLIQNRQEHDRAAAYLKRYLSQEPEGRAPTLAEATVLLKQLGR
jgi:tetratricopeptide (TPR) repeat protein